MGVPQVLRGFPTQREVTRCGCSRSARMCASCSAEWVCFWQSLYSGLWILLFRPLQVKTSMRFIRTKRMRTQEKTCKPRVSALQLRNPE
ncbi:hypothetical protein EMIT0324P_50007 [Pseudomonas chlororaphis]